MIYAVHNAYSMLYIQTVLQDLYIPAIVHFTYIDQLLPPRSRDIFRMALASERLESGFDDIHRVPRSSDARGEIGDTGTTAHFEDVCLCPDAES